MASTRKAYVWFRGSAASTSAVNDTNLQTLLQSWVQADAEANPMLSLASTSIICSTLATDIILPRHDSDSLAQNMPDITRS